MRNGAPFYFVIRFRFEAYLLNILNIMLFNERLSALPNSTSASFSWGVIQMLQRTFSSLDKKFAIFVALTFDNINFIICLLCAIVKLKRIYNAHLHIIMLLETATNSII